VLVLRSDELKSGRKVSSMEVGPQASRGGYKEEAAAEGERKKLFRRKQQGSSGRWVL
jgi:hypothetical protein